MLCKRLWSVQKGSKLHNQVYHVTTARRAMTPEDALAAYGERLTTAQPVDKLSSLSALSAWSQLKTQRTPLLASHVQKHVIHDITTNQWWPNDGLSNVLFHFYYRHSHWECVNSLFSFLSATEPQFLSFLDDESKTALLAALGHYGNIADATIILEDIYKRNKKFTKPQFCAYVAHTVQRRNLPGTEQYFDMVLKFNPTSEQISCIFSKSLQLIVSGLLHYAGKIQSLEQTVKLWLRLKNQSSVPKYYLDTLRAVIDCKKRVFDAKQLHVRLEQALRSKPQKQAVAESMKEVIEFMNTLASRIEYGWQNWDE